MWQILIAELKQETATFNPVLTRYGDFRIHNGSEILDAYRDTDTELAGAMATLSMKTAQQVMPVV